MVDVSTSPLFPYDSDDDHSDAEGVAPPTAAGVTFMTEREMTSCEGVTSHHVTDGEEGGGVDTTSRRERGVDGGGGGDDATAMTARTMEEISRLVKPLAMLAVREKAQRTVVQPIARSVSFSERPPPPRRLVLPRPTRVAPPPPPTARAPADNPPESGSSAQPEAVSSAPERDFFSLSPMPGGTLPDTARSNITQESALKRRSSSVSDLTDIGSIFSWHDKEFERRAAPAPGRSGGGDPDSVGPTSFFQRQKSKSLLDLLKPPRREASYLSDGGQLPATAAVTTSHGQRWPVHPAFRPDRAARRGRVVGAGPLPWAVDAAERGWKDMANTRVIDHADYERFASRRKPATPALAGRRPCKSHSPKSVSGASRELRYSQGENGKMYPMFVNVGSQAKRLGRSLYNRKLLKSK